MERVLFRERIRALPESGGELTGVDGQHGGNSGPGLPVGLQGADDFLIAVALELGLPEELIRLASDPPHQRRRIRRHGEEGILNREVRTADAHLAHFGIDRGQVGEEPHPRLEPGVLPELEAELSQIPVERLDPLPEQCVLPAEAKAGKRSQWTLGPQGGEPQEAAKEGHEQGHHGPYKVSPGDPETPHPSPIGYDQQREA